MKYVALLRGINVGGNNKVEMPQLKKVFEHLGFTNVLTYINSGNVIFESNEKKIDHLTDEIEKALKKKWGFPIKIVLREGNAFKKCIKGIPTRFKNDDEQKTDILFLWSDFDSKLSLKLIHTNPDVDFLLYLPGAIVWNVQRALYKKSGMNKFVGTVVYKHMTARNINTVRKLGELLG